MSEARAAKRRREWTGGVASSFDQLGDVDLEQWLAVPAAERLAMVFDMWNEQLATEGGQHEAAGRLQRAVGGVRPFGR